MGRAFLFVVALGAAIGFLWPTGKPAAPAPSPPGADVAARAETVSGPTPELRETVLERSDGGHFYANVEVNGQLVRFLVDTGATGVALTEKDAARIGIPFAPSEFEVVGEGASGPVRGKRITLDRVTLDGKEVRDVHGAILQGGGISLLGQAYLGQFAVEMRGDTMRIH